MSKFKFNNYTALTLSAIALSTVACGEDSAEGGVSREAVVKQYSAVVYASMQDAVNSAEALHDSVHELLESPSQKTLDAARSAWKASREAYLQTEAYRFYNGPIEETEGMINAWPLDEMYIDYVEGEPAAGIVNDPRQKIDAKSLMALNEQGGEENIATGYHAIEFLLWGQDLDADGPGDRPFTDYVTGDNGGSNADRRGEYLIVVADLLVEQLTDVAAQWQPGKSGNFRGKFENGDPDFAIGSILTGLTTLSGFETGGERLQTALNSGEQNDEHSCFSDNTDRDMVQDVQGVLNVWTGTFTAADGKKLSAGPGLDELVEEADPELFAKLDKQIKTSLTKAKALQPPFDNEISEENPEGRERVDTLIQALTAQSKSFDRAATVLGVDLIPQE